MTYLTWPHDNIFLKWLYVYDKLWLVNAFDTVIVKISDSNNDYAPNNDHDNVHTDLCFDFWQDFDYLILTPNSFP